MALPTQQFNPYSNSSGNTNFLSRFNRPAVMPQQGGNRQIPQNMIDANARASALTSLEAPTNYGSAENMRNMMKSRQGGVPDYATGGDYSGGKGFGIPFAQNMGQLGVMPQQGEGGGTALPTGVALGSPEFMSWLQSQKGTGVTQSGFDTNGPDVNSPYFAGFSAPMPNGYNTGAPVNFNSMVDSFGQPYAGRGSLANDAIGGPDVNSPYFAGVGAINPNSVRDGDVIPTGFDAYWQDFGDGTNMYTPVTQSVGESSVGSVGYAAPTTGIPQQAMSNVATSNPAPPAMAQTPAATSSNIDPAIQPYLGYGLSEAQRLYQAGGPQYYGGPTFVSPSITTQTGLQALEARAKLGNPLLQSAQNQLQGTVSGDYLSGNPFFQGAFQPAAKAAESQFKTTLGDIASKSSLAGRYGSGAMGSLQDRATGVFGQQLANTAGQLAYQNYEAERGRQQAATMAAPTMTSADYQDIQNLLNAGQLREGYTGQQLQSDMARFNFLQNQPQQNLQAYLQSVYGNPTAKMQQQPDTSPSGLQNLLGTAALLGGVEKNTGWLSSGWNKLFGE